MWRRLAAGPKSVCFSKGYVRLFFVIAFLELVTKKCASDRPDDGVVVFLVTKFACPPPSKPTQNGVKNSIFRNVGDHFRTSLLNYPINRPN